MSDHLPHTAHDEGLYASAHELIARYRSREISPREVLQAILERVASVDSAINAVSFLDAERARAAASASEERWRRGTPIGPLDGVPVTIKDHIAVQGTVTCYGTNAFNEQRIPDAVDAPVAARLKEAGAIVFAKTTMPDFGLIPSGLSSRFGTTHNPWDPTRSPGGSSSGAAAGLVAGYGPLAIGSDGGGSIRIPAAFCGAFGLKPSYGRVPYLDPVPWVVAGPMTRSVLDAALMMNVITQPDARDFASLPYDPRDHLDGIDGDLRGTRIALMDDVGFGPKLDPEVGDALQAAARVFESLGAVVQAIPPLFSKNPEPDFDRLLHVRSYVLFATMTRAQQDSMLPVLAQWCRKENEEPKLLLMQSIVNVGWISSATLAPFAECEFLLAPVMSAPPFPVDAPWTPGGTAHNPFCLPFNVTGQPAATVHGGFSRDGWPIGLQIVGRRFDDRGVLRAAHAYEQATGFLARRPPI